MSRAPRPARPVIVVRIMALVSVVLAVMCAALAIAWQKEREVAACWRVAAQFERQPDEGCEP